MLLYYVCIILFHISLIQGSSTYFSTTSEFLDVATSSGFVDKSTFIKSIMTGPRSVLITAPRRFGKSTNLHMLKTFLSFKSFNNTEISNVFKSLLIFKDNKIFFNNNFGKHCVLYINFVAAGIASYDDALSRFQLSISRTYNEHKYLLHSSHLSNEEKIRFSTWLNNFDKMTKHDVEFSLELLARYLEQHHGKKVIVLIDEYDGIINAGLFGCKSNEDISSIITMTSSLIASLAKYNENVGRTIITGVSYISSTGLSEINNLVRYNFLDNHELVDFYGFTQNEVNLLLNKTEFKKFSKEKYLVKKWYNGYTCKRGRQIYNTQSILNFLQTGEFIQHWDVTSYPDYVFKMLKSSEMKDKIDKLLAGETIQLIHITKIKVRDVYEIKNLFAEHNQNYLQGINILLNHLLELGYLTYNVTGNVFNRNIVQLPNKEVYEIIFNEYKTFYMENWKLPSFVQEFKYKEFITYINKLQITKRNKKTGCKYLLKLVKSYAEKLYKYLSNLF